MADIIPPLVVVTACFAILVAVGMLTIGAVRRAGRLSRIGVVVSVTPSLVQLALFYSLAVHMYWSLGGLPDSIGERGFPPHLLTHVAITLGYFGGFVLCTVFLWPVAFLLCLLVSSWRRWTAYAGLYFLSCALCLGIMHLAPSRFINWWWD